MIGNKVCFFESIDSTNTFMKQNLSLYMNGDILCARIQTSGKGRRSNSWLSLDGNLHMSMLIENNEKRDISFYQTMVASNVLCNVLQKYGVDAKIKYPNDIVVGKKKIAGILIERSIGKRDVYVIGIGLNIVTENFDLLQDTATSIFLETNKSYDYRDVLWQFIKEYNSLIDCKNCDLYKMYIDRSVVFGEVIIIDNKEYLVKDINMVGDIVLECDGVEEYRQLNEVTLKEFYSEDK